jgi:hypothetical protein
LSSSISHHIDIWYAYLIYHHQILQKKKGGEKQDDEEKNLLHGFEVNFNIAEEYYERLVSDKEFSTYAELLG